MARPKGTTKGDVRKAVQVRLSRAERLQLDAGAARDGMPLSTWLRWLGLTRAGAVQNPRDFEGVEKK